MTCQLEFPSMANQSQARPHTTWMSLSSKQILLTSPTLLTSYSLLTFPRKSSHPELSFTRLPHYLPRRQPEEQPSLQQIWKRSTLFAKSQLATPTVSSHLVTPKLTSLLQLLIPKLLLNWTLKTRLTTLQSSSSSLSQKETKTSTS